MENAGNVVTPLTKSVLVVDDHPNTAAMLARAIQKIEISSPVNVLTAVSGEEALDQFVDRAVEVLIVDFMLPGMSGLDLIVALRESNRLPENIILISAYTVLESQIEDLELKIDALFSKPVKTEKILNLVKGLLVDPEAEKTKWIGGIGEKKELQESNGQLPGEEIVQPSEEKI